MLTTAKLALAEFIPSKRLSPFALLSYIDVDALAPRKPVACAFAPGQRCTNCNWGRLAAGDTIARATRLPQLLGERSCFKLLNRQKFKKRYKKAEIVKKKHKTSTYNSKMNKKDICGHNSVPQLQLKVSMSSTLHCQASAVQKAARISAISSPFAKRRSYHAPSTTKVILSNTATRSLARHIGLWSI